MSKPVLNVKKMGQTCVFFVDTSTERPRSITHFDEQCPDDLFAFVSNEEGVLARFSHSYDIRFLEKIPANLPTSVRVKATPQDLGLQLPVQQPAAIETIALELNREAFIQRGSSTMNAITAKVLKELEFYLVKLDVAEGKRAKALLEEYGIVRAFCVKLVPELEIEIVSLEETYGR